MCLSFVRFGLLFTFVTCVFVQSINFYRSESRTEKKNIRDLVVHSQIKKKEFMGPSTGTVTPRRGRDDGTPHKDPSRRVVSLEALCGTNLN